MPTLQSFTLSSTSPLPQSPFKMFKLSGDRPKLSILSGPRRTSVLTVFSFAVLLVYVLLPRDVPIDSRDTFPHEAFHRYDLPTEPVAQKVSEQPDGSLLALVKGYGIVNADQHSITDTTQHSITDKGGVNGDTVDTEANEEVADTSKQFTPGCLRRVFYDKPVKTGSTAITYAIREYIKSTGRLDLRCNLIGDSCEKQAQRVCQGTHKRQKQEPSFLGHFRQSNGSTIECLKKLGYYAVTSIRDPYQRRKSAYLYNKTVKGFHYSIPYTVSFEEFMARLPRCVLHHYYDGLGSDCDVGIGIEERVRRIVERYDEVIELGGEVNGPLFGKIVGYIERQNESHREEIREKFDEDTLREETLLYNALREKMLKGGSDRVPC